MDRTELIASIPASWRDWLLQNSKRGCSLPDLIKRAEAAGYSRAAIEAVLELDESPSAQGVPSWIQWFEPPLTRPDHCPRAWRLDTPLAQIYEIPDFLDHQECQMLIEAIDRQLVPSTVTYGDVGYRTSRTCHLLRGSDSDLAKRLDRRLAALFAADPCLSEPLQGQRYDIGEYFKEHTDWFAPGTKEFTQHTNPGGQRTWTVMIYLNSVSRGGQTCFKRLERCFTPVRGLALAWNNLMPDGTPNPFTLHEAMPVQEGTKWVITKWFRAQSGRND